MSSIPYRHDITGLRGLAIFTVLIYHAFPSILPGGYLGVDLFFVISGYLITSIMLSEMAQNKFSLVVFYQRRMMRLLPSLFVCFTLCLLAGWWWLFPDEYKNLSQLLMAGSGFFSNFSLLHQVGYFDQQAQAKPLLHLWSLSIEEQFYFICPLLILALTKWRVPMTKAFVVLGLLSWLFCLVAGGEHHDALFYLPWARAWELLIGVVMAVALHDTPTLRDECVRWVKKVPRLSGVSGLAVLMIIVSLLFPYQHHYHMLWLVLALLGCSWFIFSQDAKFLQQPVLCFFGRISYPLYLVHWPFLSFLWIIEGEPPSMLATSVALILSTGLAYGLTEQLEQRVRRKTNRPRVCRILMIILLVLVGCAAMIDYHKGFPDRLNSPFAKSQSGFAQHCDKRQAVCHFGSSHAKKTMLIYGDSHVGHLSQALINRFSHDYAIDLVWQGGCFMGSGLAQETLSGNRQQRCHQAIAYLRSQQGHHYDTIITGQRWEGYPLQGRDHLEALLRDRQNTFGIKSTRLIILGSAPVVAFECERSHYRPHRWNTKNCHLPAPSRAVQDFNEISKVVKGRTFFVYPSQLLCPGGVCQAVREKTALYEDNHHLSYAGAQVVVDHLTQWIG